MHRRAKMNKPNFFEAGSPFFVHPLLTDTRTESESEFLVSELALLPGARVLDVGCGFGRHSVALAKRGLSVTGIDPSGAMIAAAQARAAQAAVAVHFQQSRGDQFSTTEQFKAAICLFTTLGQIDQDGDNHALVPHVYKLLKPGGKFVVEVPQRNPTVQALIPSDKFGEGARYTLVQREYHPGEKTVTESFTKITPEYTRHYLLAYRLYSAPELRALLTDTGFTIAAVYEDYARTPLADDSASMLFVAEK